MQISEVRDRVKLSNTNEPLGSAFDAATYANMLALQTILMHLVEEFGIGKALETKGSVKRIEAYLRDDSLSSLAKSRSNLSPEDWGVIRACAERKIKSFFASIEKSAEEHDRAIELWRREGGSA
jgi:hypothetical protein